MRAMTTLLQLPQAQREPQPQQTPESGTQIDKNAEKIRHGAAEDRCLWDFGKAPNPYSLPSYTYNALQESIL